MQDGSLPARFRHQRRRVMAAHVVETTQPAVMATHHHNRFPGNAGGHKLSRLFHLLQPSHHLPGFAEDSLSFEFRNPRIHVPGAGDGRGVWQRGFIVVATENFLYRHLATHAPIALFSTSRNWAIRASFFSCGSPWRRNSPGSNSSVSSASWKRSMVQSRMETIMS